MLLRCSEAILEHVQETAEIVHLLRSDGWLIELQWGPDESSYMVTHAAFRSAKEANERLAALGIKRFTCFDVAALLDGFK